VARALKAADLPAVCGTITPMGSLKSITFQLGSPGAISFYPENRRVGLQAVALTGAVSNALQKPTGKAG